MLREKERPSRAFWCTFREDHYGELRAFWLEARKEHLDIEVLSG